MGKGKNGSKKMVQMPGCLSGYDAGDTICDGDPAGETEYDQAVCAWRDRCMALQLYLGEHEDKTADNFMNITTDEDGNAVAEATQAFVDSLDNMVEHYGVKDGTQIDDEGTEDDAGLTEEDTATEASNEDDGATEDAREAAVEPDNGEAQPAKKQAAPKPKKATKSAASKRKQAIMDEMLPHLMKHIDTEFNDRSFNKKGEAPVPGQFYVVDRMGTSGYVNIACKTATGRDKPLVQVVPKSRSGNVDVLTPVEQFKGVGKDTMKKLDMKPWDDGTKTLFKTITKEADKERLALLAFALKKAHEKGALDLPETQ